MKNIPKETTDALIALGWTPPEDTPKQAPVRGWVNKRKGNNPAFVIHKIYDDARFAAPHSRNKPTTVEVIEAGYVLPVKHDGSDKCPVDPVVGVVTYTGYGFFVDPAGTVAWKDVTHYAVLTPRKELK